MRECSGAIWFTGSMSFRLRFLLCENRRDDIPLLVEYFIVDRYARKRSGKEIPNGQQMEP